jgi:hypothetical protein
MVDLLNIFPIALEIKSTLQCVSQLGSGPFPEPGKSCSRPHIPLKTEFITVLTPKPKAYKVSLPSMYSKHTL